MAGQGLKDWASLRGNQIFSVSSFQPDVATDNGDFQAPGAGQRRFLGSEGSDGRETLYNSEE